jgi:hypothetical protein
LIDVHPPHHALNGWREFMLHMLTIVLGLLIAIGLEQSVEYFHHQHELREFREGLRQDCEKSLKDDEEFRDSFLGYNLWLATRMDQVHLALSTHAVVPDLAPVRAGGDALPIDPAWTAAKASGMLTLMPQDDIKAFTEVDILITELNQKLSHFDPATKRAAFEEQFHTDSKSYRVDLSGATRADLVQYLTLLTEEHYAAASVYVTMLNTQGALEAVLDGERNLDRIDARENATERTGMAKLRR